MKKLSSLVMLLLGMVACGEPPHGRTIEEVKSAFTFPPNGSHWYESYASTHMDCGPWGVMDTFVHGAVQLRTSNVGNLAGVIMDSNAAQINPWTHQWVTVGSRPDPGPVVDPSAQAQEHKCAIQLFSPNGAESNAAGFAVDAWALAVEDAEGPYCTFSWDATHHLGPVHVNHLPGGYWADWLLEPQLLGAPATQGWHLHSSGQIWNTHDNLPVGCAYQTNAYLYQSNPNVPYNGG